MYHSLFISLLAKSCLGCLQLGVIINKTIKNTCIHVLYNFDFFMLNVQEYNFWVTW
jgi:hypothetical protein